MRFAINVAPGLSYVTNITGGSVYSDFALQNAVTFPQTIAAPTDYYVADSPASTVYTISCKWQGVELLGMSRPVSAFVSGSVKVATFAPEPTLDQMGGALTTAYVSVNEGPLYAEDPRLGLVGDGSTDNAGKDATIKTLLGANGGEVRFRNGGLYLSSAPWNFDSTSGVVLDMGENNTDRTQTPNSELRFTAAGTTPQLTAKTSEGFTVKGGAVRYSSATFTGRFISVTGAGTPTYRPTFKNTVLGGSSGTAVNAAYVLDLGNTVEATFSEAAIARAAKGVMGYDGTATYSTAVTFKGGRFVDLGSGAIDNPHQGWTALGTVFENLTGGGVGGIASASGFPVQGMALLGAWFGDASLAGVLLDLYGSGVLVAGCYVGLPNVAGSIYARLNGAFRGFRSIGNDILAGASATYLASANTPTAQGVFLDDMLQNGILDNSASVAGISFSTPVTTGRRPVVHLTANYTAGISDFGKVFLCDATGGAIAFTLPDSQIAGALGQAISVKKIDSSANAVAVNPVGGQRLDQGFGTSLATQGKSLTMYCDALTAPGGWYTTGQV